MIVRRFPNSMLDVNFDRAFEQLANSFFEPRRQAGPVVDGAWHDDEYVLTVDLPGVPAEAVSVEVRGDTLSLGAATDKMEWQRTLRLGDRLDPGKVRASHVDGRLTVRIGTHDEPAVHMVTIETAPIRPAISTATETIATDVTATEVDADAAQSIEANSSE